MCLVITHIIIWSAVEPCLSIVAACLPIVGPVYIDKMHTLNSSTRSFIAEHCMTPVRRNAKRNESRAQNVEDSSSRGWELIDSVELANMTSQNEHELRAI